MREGEGRGRVERGTRRLRSGQGERAREGRERVVVRRKWSGRVKGTWRATTCAAESPNRPPIAIIAGSSMTLPVVLIEEG